jgi:hypothetical protein
LQKLSAAALASMLASATVEAELAADRAVHTALIRARRHDAGGFSRVLQGSLRVLQGYFRVIQGYSHGAPKCAHAGGRRTRAVRAGSRTRRTRMTRCTTRRGASAARSWVGLAPVRSHAHALGQTVAQ